MNNKKMKTALSTFVIFLLTLTSIPALLWAQEPGKVIMEAIDRGLVILKDPSLKGDEKLLERRQKLWQEISPVFHFEEMAKRALGQYWKSRSPEEKKEFTELFTNILKDAYIGKTDTYSGEKIIFIKEKQADKYANVQTKFVTNQGTEIFVDYYLFNDQGNWRVYDVVIEGVSLINNYRTQFNSILVKSSYRELVQKIKEKNANG